jgi:hypothetical protein
MAGRSAGEITTREARRGDLTPARLTASAAATCAGQLGRGRFEIIGA